MEIDINAKLTDNAAGITQSVQDLRTVVTEAKKEFQDDKARLANLETMMSTLSQDSRGSGEGNNKFR